MSLLCAGCSFLKQHQATYGVKLATNESLDMWMHPNWTPHLDDVDANESVETIDPISIIDAIKISDNNNAQKKSSLQDTIKKYWLLIDINFKW